MMFPFFESPRQQNADFSCRFVASYVSYGKGNFCILTNGMGDMTTSDRDRALIALLGENARMPVAELARKLGLSRTTVQARIERLEADG
jgi:DNA-binding CsgD family transcriptional regulator